MTKTIEYYPKNFQNLTEEMLGNFYNQHCRACGSQLCPGVYDDEWREGCRIGKQWFKINNKRQLVENTCECFDCKLKEQSEIKNQTTMENKYNMSFAEAQEYISKRGFDIMWNDDEIHIDERDITQTVANVLKWADEHPVKQQESEKQETPFNDNDDGTVASKPTTSVVGRIATDERE